MVQQTILILVDHEIRYGIKAELVVEILHSLSVTPLPGGLDYIKGVLNYEGQAVPVLSISEISGKKESKNKDICIILETNHGKIGLLTDRGVKIIQKEFEMEDYNQMDINCGILKISKVILGDNPIFMIDIEKVLDTLKEM